MLTGKVGVAPGTTTIRLNPYASIEDMKGSLGLVPHPMEALRSLGPSNATSNYLPAYPGAIPNDFELATMYQYTPVHAGWYQTLSGPGGYPRLLGSHTGGNIEVAGELIGAALGAFLGAIGGGKWGAALGAVAGSLTGGFVVNRIS